MTKLIVISAPSGAGKTTLCERLLKDIKMIKLSISSTTRLPRGQETHGREYFFLKEADFKAGIERDEFAEWALVHGNYYGTSKRFVSEAFQDGYSVLLDIDVQGAASLRKTFPKDCFSVFISPPSLQVLEQRLRARGTDKEETILKRLRNAKAEMDRKNEFDLVVINDSLDRAYEELRAAVSTQLSREQ
ncbi:MAG: guanylate kinase [Bdellovibrionales bacterium GWB1_52_6]|nr:MAG: guanylate kinase [Bdellovibrionales bacterium GWB1_52_6]OFZ04177.1 MAG: guanylate kinase [Bdellovibrionales bacterium GWA1_52_35]HCM40522.1 guanylate kinase [Bdellovibrionales bacterium]